MIYEMTELADAIRIDGIYTVLKADYMKNGGVGESHDFPELVYYARGEVWGVRDGVDNFFREGEMTLIPPGTFHKKKKPSDCEGWIISFASRSPMLEGLYNQTIALTGEEREELAAIFSLGLRCFRKNPQGGMMLSSEADVYMLTGLKKRLELFLLGLHRRYGREVAEEQRQDIAEVARVCILLSEHIAENLTVEQIAALANISVSKLKRLFREKGGVLHAFIRMKVERAKGMIRAGQMNFSEIAQALGFASLHYFSRTFKNVTGISPSRFRHIL